MTKDLTEGKPEKVLIGFCMPLLGSVVFQQLYNIADSLIAGRYAGENALAAVGNSYEITLIYLAFAFGCNMGCSVIVSQLFGAKRFRDMKTAINTTFVFSGILCFILTLTGLIFGRGLLILINTPDGIINDSKLYLDIYTFGLVFLFFYNIATGIFSALGDSKTPFTFLAISSVANVFADILFVKLLDMGVAGVAWATFMCQGVSCVLSMIVVLRRLAAIKLEPDEAKPQIFSRDLFGRIIRIAIPSTLQQSFVSIGNIILQGRINYYGSSVIAGYSAAIKLNNMVITTFTALGNGISNFSAQNLGAGKNERIKEGRNAGIKLVLFICIVVTAFYLIAGEKLVGLFMKSDSVKAIAEGVKFLQTVAPFYIVVAIKLATDGVLRGVGAMKQFMLGTFSDLLLRVALAFVFSAQWGSSGIWAAWPVGWINGTIISVVMYRLLIKNIDRHIIA